MKRQEKVIAVVLVLACVFATAVACEPENHDTTVKEQFEQVGEIKYISIGITWLDSNSNLITDEETIDALIDELGKIPLNRMAEYDEEYFYSVEAQGTEPYLVFLAFSDENIKTGPYYSVAMDYEGTVYFLWEEKNEEGARHITELFGSKPNSIDTNKFLDKYLK